jgi:REP element-mobilizing transposase RayT
MARALEVEGGLYHVIVRGNNRRRFDCRPTTKSSFRCRDTENQTAILPLCILSDDQSRIFDRETKDSVGRIMHRVLTGYSQYYNRRYQRVGHLLQGRHKSNSLSKDRYLASWFAIFISIQCAQMVSERRIRVQRHRAYLGLEAAGIVDVEPVLRHFGAKKPLAREAYRQFVAAGMTSGHQEQFYLPDEGRILGTEEFVDETIHRLGESKRSGPVKLIKEFKAERLIEAVERVCRVPREDFCGSRKTLQAIVAREPLS